jgi:branched-chain amino acid transport system substrate-binding protein
MAAVLKASADNLTRENVMKQAASIHTLKLPTLLPGIALSTSADDFAPIKQMQLMKFNGITWHRLFTIRSWKMNANPNSYLDVAVLQPKTVKAWS